MQVSIGLQLFTVIRRECALIHFGILLSLQGSFPAKYHVNNTNRDSCCLDNNYQAFLLVDDGSVGRRGGDTGFRAKLEDYISHQRTGIWGESHTMSSSLKVWNKEVGVNNIGFCCIVYPLRFLVELDVGIQPWFSSYLSLLHCSLFNACDPLESTGCMPMHATAWVWAAARQHVKSSRDLSKRLNRVFFLSLSVLSLCSCVAGEICSLIIPSLHWSKSFKDALCEFVKECLCLCRQRQHWHPRPLYAGVWGGEHAGGTVPPLNDQINYWVNLLILILFMKI